MAAVPRLVVDVPPLSGNENVSVPVGTVTANEIDALALRDWVSVTVTAMVTVPAEVDPGTVTLNEKVLSPESTSPLVPSSANACVDEPPIEERLAVTAIPVLVGFVPGATTTVNRTVAPVVTESGVAVPVAVGLVEDAVNVAVAERV